MGFNIQGMLIGMLTGFLFMSLLGLAIVNMGVSYDITGYDSADIAKYQGMDNLSITINQTYQQVDKVTVDRGAFDFFADMYNKVLSPFKFIYRSFATLIGMADDVIEDLRLPPVVGVYFVSVLIVLLIIGVVMIKFFMNREK